MIEINIVPPQLRKKKKKAMMPGGMSIPLEVVIGLGGGLFMLLVVVHVVFLFINIKQVTKHKALKSQWATLEPDKKKVDVILVEMRELTVKTQAIEKISKEHNILWSKKLNIISDVLPKGVWIRKVAFTDQVLFIEGSAISRQRDGMINVHEFTSNLKQSEGFLDGLEELELGSVQRRKINKVEITDFLISARIK